MKKNKLIYLLILVCICANSFAQQEKSKKIDQPISSNESWWLGIINHGEKMPLTEGYSANMEGNNYGNQIQPLLLSSDGQFIWSENAFEITVENSSLSIQSKERELVVSEGGNTLRDGYLKASKQYFPPSGKLPDLDLVRYPQYNTWIELLYDQNQQDIMDYAKSILSNGFPPGVIMVDDNWQEDYGNWDFHPERFSDPKAMIDSLHSMGFKVMMWVCPFVSPDSYIYRDLKEKGCLLKDSTGNPAIVRWWNGASGLLDFTNPDAFEWFDSQLQYLVDNYGVDGFKLDAGDPEYYRNTVASKPVSPNEHSRLYGLFGLNYPLNEYRAMWKMGGEPLVQRLRDKKHDWDDLQKLIPHILLQGIMGYSFTCPDMIGGGEAGSFINDYTIDQDLVVRSAQCHALMPMMQFSAAPWRILDETHLAACKKAVEIRQENIGTILDLIKKSAATGEPVVRMMEYVFPHQGYANIKDQFMLGDDMLVAPVLKKGATSRELILPKGNWKDWNGKVIKGSKTINVEVGLDDVPYFILHK